MGPALHVIQRALDGDPSAQSFLEQTTTVYMLDLTDSSNPKTYGCWNFIHQALNEVERYENGKKAVPTLISHVRLLCSMARRSARRSLTGDRNLLSTCIANASEYHGSDNQTNLLVDVNIELREIVMGRIAALAFDFGFHKKAGLDSTSAFADPVVLDSFCAVLSANAVSNGPRAIYHFANEWIVPSAKTIPPFALASVVHHLASDGVRLSAPVGTKEALQQLSVPVVAAVLIPALQIALTDEDSDNSSSDGQQSTSVPPRSLRAEIAANILLALKAWSNATDLSLPQIRHICNKTSFDLVNILSDAMYSDSPRVLDAIADFIEGVIDINDEKIMSEGRMNQVRYIIQVDEASFRSNFSVEQLRTIECKEMAAIVDELMTAIGLQRFRFLERQKSGDENVCRNLARIAVAICATWLDVHDGETVHSDSGVLNFLLKAGSHPLVHVSGLVLPVLAKLATQVPGITHDLLPILQRRAILPHIFQSGTIVLTSPVSSGVNFHDFEMFRDTSLTECLVACWKVMGNAFFDSCTSAIEEFCSDHASLQVSLHLEAAIFCLATIADNAISGRPFTHSQQLQKCIVNLSNKPTSLMQNPLTLAQTSVFIAKYATLICEYNLADMAVDILVSVFSMLSVSNPQEGVCRDIVRETSINPASQAAAALQQLLCYNPKQFTSARALDTFHNVWRSAVTTSDHSLGLPKDDCELLAAGLCQIAATIVDSNESICFFESLVTSVLKNVEHMLEQMKNASASKNRPGIKDLTSQIVSGLEVICTLSEEYSNRLEEDDRMEGDTSEYRSSSFTPVLNILHTHWSIVLQISPLAKTNHNITSSLSRLAGMILPSSCDASSIPIIREVFGLMTTVIGAAGESLESGFDAVCRFLKSFVAVYHAVLNRPSGGGSLTTEQTEAFGLFKTLFQNLIQSTKSAVRNSWVQVEEQMQGQAAFEMKIPKIPRATIVAPKFLSGLFALVQIMLEKSPRLLLDPGFVISAGNSDELFFRQVFDSAVTSIKHLENGPSLSAVEFIRDSLKRVNSSNPQSQELVSECIQYYRTALIYSSVKGSLGQFDEDLLPGVARLLHELLSMDESVETKECISAAVNQPDFSLGRPCQVAISNFLYCCARRTATSDDLETFLSKIRLFYQADDIEAMPTSDFMAKFLREYALNEQ